MYFHKALEPGERGGRGGDTDWSVNGPPIDQLRKNMRKLFQKRFSGHVYHKNAMHARVFKSTYAGMFMTNIPGHVKIASLVTRLSAGTGEWTFVNYKEDDPADKKVVWREVYLGLYAAAEAAAADAEKFLSSMQPQGQGQEPGQWSPIREGGAGVAAAAMGGGGVHQVPPPPTMMVMEGGGTAFPTQPMTTAPPPSQFPTQPMALGGLGGLGVVGQQQPPPFGGFGGGVMHVPPPPPAGMMVGMAPPQTMAPPLAPCVAAAAGYGGAALARRRGDCVH